MSVVWKYAFIHTVDVGIPKLSTGPGCKSRTLVQSRMCCNTGYSGGLMSFEYLQVTEEYNLGELSVNEETVKNPDS